MLDKLLYNRSSESLNVVLTFKPYIHLLTLENCSWRQTRKGKSLVPIWENSPGVGLTVALTTLFTTWTPWYSDFYFFHSFLQLFFYSFTTSDQMRKRENIASKDGFWSGYFEKISSFFFFPYFNFSSKSLSWRCQESRFLDFSVIDLSTEHFPGATHHNTATVVRGNCLISQSSILQTRKLKPRNNEQLIRFISNK